MSDLQTEQLNEKLRQSLRAIKELKKELAESKQFDGPLAVVGMSCRFPGGVRSPDDYWNLLMNEGDAISEIPADRWDVDAFYDPDPQAPGKMYTRNGGFVDGIDRFDAQFFGISPNEAEAIDPQQRILLRAVWEAFEQAGIPIGKMQGSMTGVFVGVATPDYIQKRAFSGHYQLVEPYDVTGNTSSTASGRISYTFDFHGPNMVVDTACSSSLVAVHLACQSLLKGESEMAVAGGVNLILEPNAHIIFSRMKAIAPDGRCKVFDAAADGFVRSEGCGIVLLKRLKDAVRDGNRVLAVIRGSAINQDGHSNGLTAPNGAAQERVIRTALENADLVPDDIVYLEAHGTGTPLGDPIELEAINKVFARGLPGKHPLYIGSVKSNLGHLESAAGMASLIKTILVLQNRTIPAQLHFRHPSPFVSWKDFVRIPVKATKLDATSQPVSAGVSAFGFSGTNAHLILQEYKEPAASIEAVVTREPEDGDIPKILVLSAKSEKALKELASRYERYLSSTAGIAFGDMAYTLANGRSHFPYRAAVVSSVLQDAIKQLKGLAAGEEGNGSIRGRRKHDHAIVTAFLFTGQGSQYVGMGQDLYQTEPVFRRALDECAALLTPYLDISLTDILFPAGPVTVDINDTIYAQPCIFSLEYALYRLWEHWGVKASWLAGHSVGEYVAACVAGVFSLEDGLKLITARGRLMQALPVRGTMSSVMATEVDVTRMIRAYPAVSIAAINGPESIVIAGDELQIGQIEEECKGQGIRTRRLRVSHGFHSPSMKPMLTEFKQLALTIRYSVPVMPVISNITGGPAGAEMATASYWVDHIMAPVRFSDGLLRLEKEGCNCFVEAGPMPALSSLAKNILTGTKDMLVHSLKEGCRDSEELYRGLAALYVQGFPVDWAAFYRWKPGQGISLPLYPFQEQRYWIDLPPAGRQDGSGLHPLLGSYGRPAYPADTHAWTQTFDCSTLSYLKDHQVQGTILFPAACYTEMAVSAILQLVKSLPLKISGISFDKAFVLQPGKIYQLQTIVTQQADRSYVYSIYSRPVDAAGEKQAWTLRTRGQGEGIPQQEAPVTVYDHKTAIRQCDREISGEDFYADWQTAGNQWGESFKGIKKIWLKGQDVFSESSVPGPIRQQLQQYVAHPAMLDICGQLLAAGLARSGQGAFVGRSAGSIRIYKPLRGDIWYSHATWSHDGDSPGRIKGDISVMDASGGVIAETKGVEFEFVDRQHPGPDDPLTWLYDITWQRLPVTPEAVPLTGHWLVTGRTEVPAGWVTALEGAGGSITVLRSAKDLSGQLGEPVQGVLYLADDEHTADSLAETLSSIRDVAAVLHRIKDHGARLWIVTRHAWDPSSGIVPYTSAVWGLARSIAAEMPFSWGGILDHSAQGPAAAAMALAAALGHAAGASREDAFLFRGDQLLVPRLGRVRPVPVPDEVKFRLDAAYLVTGGLGALGLETAHWMAVRGARRLILMGRKGLPDRIHWTAKDVAEREQAQIAAVRELERSGVSVQVCPVDVSDEEAFSRWYKDYRDHNWPEIGGVIHAAGIVELGDGDSQDKEHFARQLAAKVKGTVILDRYLGEKLDFFIAFSSASAVLNSPGLGAYAAANAFLDAFAGYRRARGLKALSIDWGAWADIGLAATAAEGRNQAYQAMPLIPVKKGIGLLPALWNAPQAAIAVLPADWGIWKGKYRQGALAPLLRNIIDPDSAGNDLPSAGDILPHGKLLEMNGEELTAYLEGFIVRQVRIVLRLEEGQPDPEIPLSDYGLDSMMAIEIKNRIEGVLPVALQMVDLIGGPSTRELAVKLASGMAGGGEKTVADVPVHVEGDPQSVFALSPGQKALWTLYSMDPGSHSYNVVFSTRIVAGLDIGQARDAFQRLVERHEMLRTRFVTIDNEVMQFTRAVSEEGLFHFEVVDAVNREEGELEKAVKAMSRVPFRPDRDPLMRVHFFKRSQDEHIMLITIHHLVCDGWSLWLLLDEFSKEYTVIRERRESELPVTGFTYRDYIGWQEKMLAGSEGERLWQFWKKQLAGDLPVLNLPSAQPVREDAAQSGATLLFRLDDDLSGRLKKMSAEEGVTLYMLGLAAFQLLLHRYSGQDDILIGSPTSGRNRAEFSGVCGDFINMTVMRPKIPAGGSFRDYLAGVRKTVLDALAHQDYPFPLLVRQLQPKRQAGHSPVFRVLFSLQKPQLFPEIIRLMEGQGVEWGSLSASPYPIAQQEGQFDLSLEIIEGKNALSGIFKFNTALYEDDFIRGFQEHFVHLLEGIVSDPGQSIHRIPLLSREAQQQLNRLWHHEDPSLRADKCVHELIEEQAARTPGAIALICGSELLTYDALNRQANKLAHFLREKQVGRESLVGICVDRSAGMVVSMLAVLKAGGAYLPLDPHFPADRLDFIMADAGLRYLITTRRHVSRFAAFSGQVIQWEQASKNADPQKEYNLRLNSGPGTLAYVIYTSGSTGKPKGTMVEHRNVVNFFMGMDGSLGKGPGTLLAVTTHSFDISVLELLWTLTNGFKVVIREGDPVHRDMTGKPAHPRKMDFSLFYFASADKQGRGNDHKYNLLIEGAKFADEHGYKAVWTPERHFHAFGGLYPNPSVTGAVIAAITRNVEIRAGSVVAPLHHPLRVAEEWAVIDNLSGGRAAISFASGWQVNDFVLHKEGYKDRQAAFYRNIDLVRRLWRGDKVDFENGEDVLVATGIFPRPVQGELPFWITAAGNPQTFKAAGAMGANILTHLLTQTPAELEEKIAVYREARKENGLDPDEGIVTLMLHTFLGRDQDEVREVVREPFIDYLKSSFDLMSNMALSMGMDIHAPDFAENGLELLLSRAFERYFNTASLMGTPEMAEATVDRFAAMGVTEIACLIDFGVDNDAVMQSLLLLNDVKDRYSEESVNAGSRYSIPEQVEHYQVTHLQCTPSLARMLLMDKAAAGHMGSLRQLMLGGERLASELVKKLYSFLSADIYNMYGPTETTVWSSTAKIGRQDDTIYIGKPISNTRLYVLDPHMSPVPAGVAGELYIGGAGVARGYLGRPALTAERFIKDPFSGDPGARLYRTGDLVRYTAKGDIEYIERVDDQVKVNGHRIEPGEIELLLSSHEAIRECAVVAIQNDRADQKLVAHIVLYEHEQAPAVGALRLFLSAKLPDYMIPSLYNYVLALPLTPNGKVDRKALREKELQQNVVGTKYEAPRTSVEQKLVDLWRSVLDVDKVSITDNFFELGGDSIISIQLISKAKDLGIVFTVNDLFKYQTIAELSPVVSMEGGIKSEHGSEQGIVTGFSPLIPIQRWFFDLPLKNFHHYNQALMIETPSGISPDVMRQVMQALLSQHDVLRSRFVREDGGWRQEFPEELPEKIFDTLDLTTQDGESSSAILEKDASLVQSGLDLEKGPVFLARLYDMGKNRPGRLLMVAHHLVIDGISWRVLLADIHHALAESGKQSPIRLPLKTTSYKEWAIRLNELTVSGKLDVERPYWEQLAGSDALTLPVDNEHGLNAAGSTDKVIVKLDRESTRSLLQDVPKAYHTQINDVLLSALFLTLSEWTERSQVRIDLESHGRESLFDAVDISRTAGWFTAMIPVVLTAPQENGPAGLLKSVKEQLRRMPGHGIGYGMLLYLSGESPSEALRRVGRAPVLFNYLGQTDFSFGGWKLAKEDTGPLYDPGDRRSHLLEVIGIIIGNELEFTWNYSRDIHNRETIAHIAGRFFHHLREIILHCQSPEAQGFTPSDFPGLRMSQKGLDDLLAKIK